MFVMLMEQNNARFLQQSQLKALKTSNPDEPHTAKKSFPQFCGNASTRLKAVYLRPY
jgi:hypothetical protein